MAIYTQLSPSALPGKKYSFSAKNAAQRSHAELFTDLSVLALPGRRHSFLAKTEFVPEEIEVITPSPTARRGGGGAFYYTKGDYQFKDEQIYNDIHKDDEEVLEIIIQSILNGVIN